MKLRYRISADVYIPQYYMPKEDRWQDFLVKDVTPAIEKLCMAIGNLQAPHRFDEGQWFFNPSRKEDKKEDMALIFFKEMYVMAFLGAAKATWDRTPVNFKL